MPDIRHSQMPMSPEQVVHRGFALVRRGFDPSDVRAFLDQVAEALAITDQREAELLAKLQDAETRAANPKLDEATLTSALGQETARILKSAHDAANDVLARAQDEAQRITRQALEESAQMQERAATLLADRSEEAEAAAGEIRRAARADGGAELEEARHSSEAMLSATRDECRQMVREAQELRARTLGDLARRRRILHTQVEQLRAGRVSLIEAIDTVRRSIDEIHDNLRNAEDQARAAAEAAAKRVASEPDPSGDEFAKLLTHPSRGRRGDPWNRAPVPAKAPVLPPKAQPASIEGPPHPSKANLPLAAEPKVPKQTDAAKQAQRAPADQAPAKSAEKGTQPTAGGTGDDTAPGSAGSGDARADAAGAGETPGAADAGAEDSSSSAIGAWLPPAVRIVRRSREARSGARSGAESATGQAPAAKTPATSKPEPVHAPDDEGVRILGARPAGAALTGAPEGTQVSTAAAPAGAPPAPEAAESEPGARRPDQDGDRSDVSATDAEEMPEPEHSERSTVPDASTDSGDTRAGGDAEQVVKSAPPSISPIERSRRWSHPALGSEAGAPPRRSEERRVDKSAAKGRGDAGAKEGEVHALFARIREAQASESTKAESANGSGAGDARAVGNEEPPEEPVTAEPGRQPPGDGGLLQRRDSLMEPIAAALARKLKRAMQDEQNEALDRLRATKERSLEGIFGPPSAQQDRYRGASLELLEQAVMAGGALAGVGDNAISDVRKPATEVAEELASTLALPLRMRVDQGFEELTSADEVAVADHIGAAYRGWKGHRVERLAGDHVCAAICRGVVEAVPEGTKLRWIVDDNGIRCPDCDDNGLAGPQVSGSSYPTGQPHPPAHAGCRCILAPDPT